jgi:two-component system chemotaxis sensor kinase CheA
MQSNGDRPPDIDYGAILAVFWAEAEDGVAAMEASLLKLESRPDDADALAHIFRVVHTLKGNAGQFGFTTLETLSHTAEDLLGDIRSQKVAVTPERIDLLLETVDALRDLLAKAAVGEDEPPPEHAALLRRLRARCA